MCGGMGGLRCQGLTERVTLSLSVLTLKNMVSLTVGRLLLPLSSVGFLCPLFCLQCVL